MLSRPMKMVKFNNLVEENKDEEQESGWSQLPALLLWMIMDLLHIDCFRLAFVCKHWESMSLSYPLPAERQQRQCVPWMMHQMQNPLECWDFVNLQTKERFTLEPPEHDKIAILFSRRGWLLYQSLNRLDQIILYNVHTNVKILMPEAPARSAKANDRYFGCFSTLDDDDDSTPHCVVLVPWISIMDKLFMASVNDKIMKWKPIGYYNDDERGPLLIPRNLVVHGHKLYLFYVVGGLVSFDMVNLLWKKLARGAGEYHSFCNRNIQRGWLLSSGGELVKIDLPIVSNRFSLSKLNDSETDWEELIQNDQDKRSWVIYHHDNQHFGFSVKDSRGGKKIYHLASNDQEVGSIIRIHDLISGTVQLYKPDQDGIYIWVDLGWITKMPPSCISAGVEDLPF